MNTFEQDVYALVSKCLDKDESITFDKFFDFHLPNGVKKLEWLENTYIEVKIRLIYDSFSRIQHYYSLINPSKLIVIVFDENTTSLRLESNSKMEGRNIEILSYKKLKQKIDSISIGKEEGGNLKVNEGNYRKDKDLIILEKAKEAFKKDKISLFLGAGVSASAGVVTWNSLLEQLCIKKGLPKIDSDIESVVKGRYIIDEYKKQANRKRENEKLIDFYSDMKTILYANIRPSNLIKSLANLTEKGQIESIISYNYDNLVEQEIGKYKPCYSVFDKSRPIDGKSLYIYHVHGFIPQEGDGSPIVLGEREYHKIYQESYNWGNVEQLHALCRSVCFFIGLSMTDPNLRRLIDISIDGSEVEPIHYAFLRRIEYDIPFMEKVMSGFGVNCVWYDKYEDLPKLLNSLIEEL